MTIAGLLEHLSPKGKRISDKEKLKAAYALNLCTVSVSQIIDFDDVNILEQEYNAILNNLNIQEMPKDEPFLNILKQLLDTITYFRVQEGDKQFIDREYQQKMKNAIWSAVPNFGVIVAGGLDPISMAVSLASQIGIGYMNYRKAKAEMIFEEDKEKWRLQRSAIEQFNGLRRELFDTAWRIAAKYDFPDSYRLTENQISQYNQILMDADAFRQYERMEAIKGSFLAYPPFWYYFGNTANKLASQFSTEDTALAGKYKQKAIEHFERFSSFDYSLMREDLLGAACLLEYADLLDPKSDRDAILGLVCRAKSLAGQEKDVLQLCVFTYMRVAEYSEAESILRILVNESYNKNVNAQLLSRVYIANYIASKKEDQKLDAQLSYRILESRVYPGYLLPFPTELDSLEDIEKIFIESQKEILDRKAKLVLERFFENYAVFFNKAVPVPDTSQQYGDSYFGDSAEARATRESNLSNLAYSKNKSHFIEDFRNADVFYEWLEILNKMVGSIEKLHHGIDIDHFAMLITERIKSNKEEISKLNGDDPIDLPIIIRLLSNLTFAVFTEPAISYLYDSIKAIIGDTMQTMAQISLLESSIREFCIKEQIAEPDVIFETNNNGRIAETGKIWIDASSVFGKDYEKNIMQKRYEKEKIEKMKTLLKESEPGLIIDKQKAEFFYANQLDTFLARNEKLKGVIDTKGIKVLAIIRIGHIISLLSRHLIFSSNGIWLAMPDVKNTHAEFGDVILAGKKNKDALKIGNELFTGKGISLPELYSVIARLNEIHAS